MSQKLFLYVFFTINMCERRFVNVTFVFLSVNDAFVVVCDVPKFYFNERI